MKISAKKFLSFLLITAFILAYMPGELYLFANYQYPDTNLTLTDYSPTTLGDQTYDVELSWIRPQVGPPESGAATGSNDPSARADGYRIFYRNASGGQAAYPGAPLDTIPFDDGRLGTDTEKPAMNFPSGFNNVEAMLGGSMYVFKIQPYHMHTYDLGNGNTEQRYAPYPSGELESEAIYLTDLNVEATGSGSQLTVTWDNPRFDNTQVFSHYRINYITKTDSAISNTANTRIVAMNDPEVVINTDGTASYTLTDDTLQIGSLYSVKVEPMINAAKSLRDGVKTITVADKTYPITYTPPSREYRYDNAYIQPSLRLVDSGPDEIRIEWDTLANFNGRPINEIRIQESRTEDFKEPTTIGYLLGDSSSRSTNYWPTRKPVDYDAYYRIVIYYGADNTEMISETVQYSPTHTEFTPYKPIIFSVDQNGNALNFNMLWEAFLRDAYVPQEEADLDPELGKYLDVFLNYNILVTDDLSNFDINNIGQMETTVAASALTSDYYTYEYFDENVGTLVERPTMSYETQFSDYVSLDAGGAFQRVPIEENKVYYVRIIAERDSGETSQPAYYSFYVPPTGNLPTAPVVISTPPLRIKTVNGLPQITDKDFTVQWDTKWFEVYDDGTKRWYPAIGLDAQGKLAFGDEALLLTNQANVIALNNEQYYVGINQNRAQAIQNGIEQIQIKMRSIGMTENDIALHPLRFMDLDSSSYAIHVVEFDTMMSEGGYDQYYRDNLQPFADTKATAWQAPISPANGPDHPDFTVTQEDAPDKGALQANTPYVIYFIPYMTFSGRDITASYPSYLSLTTTTERVDPPVDPTVPQIEGVDATDTTITVRWKYTAALQYELSYAELLTDYSEGGTVISAEDIAANGKIVSENDANGVTTEYIHYTVTGLFPDTKYYFWVRSYTEVSPGLNWSNPIQLETDDIETPLPPQGLGVASAENVSIINTENSTDFMPTNNDYIIVEWLRNYEDINSELAGETTAPAAGMTGGNGADEYTSPAFDVSKVVKFNDLIANRPYYIRVKTRLTVTKEGDGVKKVYTYIVQLAQAEDFLDPVELEVSEDTSTALAGAGATGGALQRDSDWAQYIIVYTRPWSGEYDGDKDPDMYPLPVDDFEVTYDGRTDTLKYRFLSDGKNENLVDQRLISKLIQNRTYVYYIDLSRYENEDIKNRAVEIPYSIVQAFEERQIGLQIIAGNVSVTFNPGWMATDQMSMIQDFGRTSRVTLNLEEDPANLKNMPVGDYVSTPQRLTANVRTNTNSLNLDYTNAPLQVDVRLENRSYDIDSNVDAYIYQTADDTWKAAESIYDSLTGKRTFETPLITSYSVAALPVADLSGGSGSEKNAAYDFTRQISVTDAHNLDMNADATSYQINNIMAAIAMDKNSFELNGFTATEEENGLSRAGLLLSGGSVSREAAVNSLLKLYEKEAGYPVSYYSSLSDTTYSDIGDAAPQYQQNLLKAAELGFFADSDARPGDDITLGEAFYMANIILQDR